MRVNDPIDSKKQKKAEGEQDAISEDSEEY